jgi:hypothetical protein
LGIPSIIQMVRKMAGDPVGVLSCHLDLPAPC